MSWKKVRFGDYTEFINGGSWSQGEYSSSGIPVVKVTNLIDGSVDVSDLSFLPKSSLHKYKKHLLKKDDLVLTTVGSHPNQVSSAAGRAIIIPAKAEGFLLNQNAVCIRSASAILDQKFLGYTGKSLPFQGYIKSIARGAANQVRIAIGLIKEFELSLPPLPIQLRIADILSAYDDLIENNLRRIQLLEEAARCRFKQMMEGSGDWVTAPVKRAIEYHIGGGWGNEKYLADFTKPAYVIRGTDIPDCRMGDATKVPFRYHKESNLRSRKLESGDLVFEVSGGSRTSPVGRALLVSEKLLSSFNGDVMCASFCKLLRPSQSVTPEYLYLFLLESYDNGALKPFEKPSASNIINFAFETYLQEAFIPIPPSDILREFSDQVGAYLGMIANLGMQNIRLRQARDIILPRLMSGEIDVEQLSIKDIEAIPEPAI